MIAAWYEKPGSADEVLIVDEMDTPTPGAGEVLIRLKSSGINPSDVKTRAGARGELPFPRIIPHSDGAGIIEAVGDGVSEDRIGERVWTYNAAWKRPFGTAAQYIALPAAQAVYLPGGASFETGACLGIPAMTAHRCIMANGSVKGKTILVTGGAGAVGHFAIQIAKANGARVITTVSGKEKADHAATANPDYILNYKTENVVEAVNSITAGEGVNSIVEVEFGGNIDTSVEILKPNGNIVSYGSQANPAPELPFYPLMFKGITVQLVLVYVLPEQARQDAISDINTLLISDHISAPIASTSPLEDIVKAHTLLEGGQVVGNVVLSIQ